MAKFKVGDKVNCADYGNGVITKIITSVMPEIPYYVVFESGKELYLGADRLTLPVAREFIVIHRSGNVITAEHRLNREIIKSAKATCAPSDTFDFDTGAKLAFDRLMGREEPQPAPAPEPPKFYTGKVFAVNPKSGWADDPAITIRNNRVYEFKDGYIVGDRCGLVQLNQPYKSFKEFAEDKYSTEWREVKEPSDV